MAQEVDVRDVAAALQVSIGLCLRQLRQVRDEDGLSLPETSALKRIDRDGPKTVTELAADERISVQSVGMTLAALESRGLIERKRDPQDGRRAILSITTAGQNMLGDKQTVRNEQLARALTEGFSSAEIQQLITAVPLLERLAQYL